MSYTVYIVKQPIPNDDDNAWRHIDSVLERRDDESDLPPDSVFLTLIDRLAARYPCPCDLPDDKEDEGMWADGPLRNNAGHSVTVLGLARGRLDEGLRFVVETANVLSLVVFDEQQGKVFRPQAPRSRYATKDVAEIYRVAITGIRAGFTREQAIRLLAPLFKRTEEEVRRLLERDKPVVKTGVPRELARKYVDALAHCGCTCELQAEGLQVALLRDTALEQCRKLAAHGDSQAQFDLGCFYYEGIGTEKDCREALAWWRSAAEQGHAQAQSNLAYALHAGEEVPQDIDEAMYWARQATDMGLAGAQYFLGERHEHGQGVAQDEQQAVHWYRKAAAQGHAEAQFRLGVLAIDA